MLLKLTCPSCGRVEQASERVLGKEVRCPCGTQFRVLQPKKAGADRGSPEARRPQAAASSSVAPRQSEARPQPSRSRYLRDEPEPRSRPGIPLEPEPLAGTAGSAAAGAAKSRGHASLDLRRHRRRRGDVASSHHSCGSSS